MVPETPPKRIVYLTMAEFNAIGTGELEAGVIYNIALDTARTLSRAPIKAPKPWEKWTQHPKSPRPSHFKKARRQPGT